MKRFVSIVIVLTLFAAMLPAGTVRAAGNNSAYVSKLSNMIKKYSEDNYFAAMSVKIGEPNLNIDGKTVPIDASGSVAYIENGRTMMPVRGIAEAIGAEVSFDDRTRTVTVENEETTIAMTIGDHNMEVNGQRVMLLSAPEIKEDRTMLPVRDVAEALGCEVSWDQDTKTAVFTRAYQTKRVVVHSAVADTVDSVAHFSEDGKTVIQFDSIEKAKKCVEVNKSNGLVAEPDYIRVSQAMSWGADDIGAQSYYSQVDYASGAATVAVIDTGIDLSHSYFSGRLVQGYDFADDDNDSQDWEGHGTHVASTVLDIAGHNPQIKVMPLKVFGNNEDTTSSTLIASAIEYAADCGVDVINLSVGGAHHSEVEQRAINKAYEKNVAVVAAAGNKSLNLDNEPYSPGGLEHVITVSAMNTNGALADFSNYGQSKIEFTAPGVAIRGAKLGGGYCTCSGTSMASPHVAGAYAIVKAAHPDASVDEITEALRKNVINKENAHYFGYGFIRVNALEDKLSSVFGENEKVENVTETTASFSGTVRYRGIIPENVGARLTASNGNRTDVNAVRFVDHGNKTMYYSCKLDGLKSGTTYRVSLFMQPGGLDYVSEGVEFTTKGDPAPPDPVVSELKILPDKYPKGTIKQGQSFGLSGRIKSNHHITTVRAYLLDANKNVVQESSGWTTTQTYVIENSSLDKGMVFGKLGAGTYYLKYYAEDEAGGSATWVSEAFQVAASVGSQLTILPDKYPKGTIKQGYSFGLSGRIKSNHHITTVRAYLLDANKNVVQESSGWTTTQTYVIENSSLDRGMVFGKLGAGTYYLKYYAEDEAGGSATWVSDAFQVAAEEVPPEPPAPIISDLKILPDDYPRGALEKGLSYGVSGRIKSNYHITDVKAYILDANKNIVQEASGWTTTQTYVIENSSLDRGLLFGKLAPGTYYLHYKASDEAGNTATWTSDPFQVTNAVDKDPAKSELEIIPKAYPKGEIPRGKVFYLSGRIRSNYRITDVRAYLLDADYNVVMEARGSTTTQAYVIENSALDTGMRFGSLSAGAYYLRYTATDESGKTANWTSGLFYVK